MRTLPWLVALLAVGCKKKDDSDDGFPFLPPPGTTDSDSGAYAPPPKVFTEVRLIGFIAWDPSVPEIRPYTYQGDGRTSRLEIRLYEGPGPDTDFCIVGIDLAGYTASDIAKTEGFAWGVDIPAGDKPWFETCTDDGWDVDQFSEDRGIDHWANADYHLRFYAPLSAELQDWLTPDNPPPDFEINHYTGGDFWTDGGGISTDADSNYWYGFELDDNWNVDPDTSTPLDQRYTMLDANGDMVRGYFVFDQRVYWEF